jgi:AcrR family transcriptional regulator
MPTQSKSKTKPKPERKLRADAERNRARILEAAAELFAERAGVGVGSVYRRFPEKTDLIDAIFEERIEKMVSFLDEALAMDDPWEGLSHFIESASAMHAADRGLRQLIFGSGHGHAFVDRGIGRVRPAVAELVTRAKASGQLREDIEVFDVPLMQIAMAGLNDYVGEAAPDAWRRVLAILLDGMRPAETERSELSAPAMEPEQLRRATGHDTAARG